MPTPEAYRTPSFDWASALPSSAIFLTWTISMPSNPDAGIPATIRKMRHTRLQHSILPSSNPSLHHVYRVRCPLDSRVTVVRSMIMPGRETPGHIASHGSCFSSFSSSRQQTRPVLLLSAITCLGQPSGLRQGVRLSGDGGCIGEVVDPCSPVGKVVVPVTSLKTTVPSSIG